MINAKKIEVRCPWMTNCKTKLPMNYKLRKCWNLLGITSSSTLRSRARSLRCTGLLNICRTWFQLSASSSRQTKLAFKLDFSGKLCTCAAFAIPAMFFIMTFALQRPHTSHSSGELIWKLIHEEAAFFFTKLFMQNFHLEGEIYVRGNGYKMMACHNILCTQTGKISGSPFKMFDHKDCNYEKVAGDPVQLRNAQGLQWSMSQGGSGLHTASCPFPTNPSILHILIFDI